MPTTTPTTQYNSQNQPGLLGSGGGMPGASTAIPGYQGAFGAAGIPFAPGTPQAIPLGIGVANTPKVPLPNKPISTANAELSGAAYTGISQPPAPTPNVNTQGTQTTATTGNGIYNPTGDNKKDFFGELNSMAARTAYLTDQSGIEKFALETQNAKNEMDAIDHQYRRQEEATNTNAMLNDATRQARLGEIGRKRASEVADLAIVYNAKLGNYQQVEKILDKKIAAETEVSKQKVAFYSDMYKITQNQNFQKMMRDEERKYQSEVSSAKDIKDLQMKLIESGVPWAEVQNVKSIGDYASLVKASTPEAKIMDADSDFAKMKGNAELIDKLTQYQKTLAETGSARVGTAAGNRLDASYQEVLQAYRAAKDLKALVGQDFQLIEDAIKKATFEKSNVGLALNVVAAGIPTGIKRALTTSRAGASIDEALSIANRNLATQTDIVRTKNPTWAETPYFKATSGVSDSATSSYLDNAIKAFSTGAYTDYINSL